MHIILEKELLFLRLLYIITDMYIFFSPQLRRPFKNLVSEYQSIVNICISLYLRYYNIVISD